MVGIERDGVIGFFGQIGHGIGKFAYHQGRGNQSSVRTKT